MSATTLPEGNAELRALLRQVDKGRHRKDRLMKGLIYGAFVLAMLPLISVSWTVLVERHRALQRLLPHALDARGVRRHGRGRHLPRDHRHARDHAASRPSSRCRSACSPPIYLVEYGRGALARSVTFFVDVMTGIPSIVAGLFAYALFAVVLGPGRSAWASSAPSR